MRSVATLVRPFNRAQGQVPGKSFADPLVGEGGLPNGARQFSNLLKVQKDWAALGKTIKARGADVTPEEWKNVALFLRRVYQASQGGHG